MDIQDREYEREQHEIARRIQAITDAQDFNAIAGTPEGRRLLRRFMSECGVYRLTFTGEALGSAYQEGRRSIGLWLIEQFNNCPDLYIQLLTEKNHDRNSNIDD